MSFKRAFVSGHTGMVGSAIVRNLECKKCFNEIIKINRKQLDLTDQKETFNFLKKSKPDYIFVASARVGGILANQTMPAEFIYQNLIIQCNLIHGAFQAGVKNLIFLGSSCIYPKNAKQPIKESQLLCGPLEPTNEPYAISKIAGLKLCESYNRQYNTNYISVMPTNLYGLGDNYHPENSHVIPALIRRFYEAKVQGADQVTIWGSGNPKREFLFSDDLAEAITYLATIPKNKFMNGINHINIGYGSEITIFELAKLIKKVVEFKGEIIFDKTKPDGTYRKLLDNSIINQLGWKPKTDLKKGLKLAFNDFLSHINKHK